ncbi:MAG: amino acid adenylation domain-containing protein [Anaerolineae bacterium]|nr:amino acid adenylation domain-containing protein [Anaerolineae bacterium]
MDENPDVSTLVALLRHRARHQPDQRAYTLIAEDRPEAISLTYLQLDRQARAIGARLQRLDTVGERVLLLLPTSIEYITAFFGCLYAGAIPIPAYPPRRNRPDPRIQAIAADAQATMMLTTSSILPNLQRRVEHTPGLEALGCLEISYPEPASDAEIWEGPAPTSDSLAYIQYSSGSTALPKGVMLSHSNLLHNLANLQEAFRIDPGGMGVSWLPLYHDMGLIGGILLALYVGGPLTMMSPVDFVQYPLRWLQAITDYGGTVSGGPNFAYQLCVDRITPEQRSTLDLSSWQVAFCGAEPVRADVLDRFSEAFAPCGFRPEVFCPCYGLAEATLAVSTNVPSTAPAVFTVQRSALEHGQVVEHVGAEQAGQTLVGCGHILTGQRVIIVDPESLSPCLPDRVGEIWVSGPSVARGYWNRPVETAQTFQAFVPEAGEGPFLRTGDLGFFKDGELFIAGRLKDLVIIRGRNYDPHDIESTAEQSHPALQPSGGAAFSVPVDGEERLVILHELRRSHRRADPEEIARAIRHAVAWDQELPVYAVALVKPGAVPRTSSGKVQRYLCRTQFMAGQFETIAVSLLEDPLHAEPSSLPQAVAAPRTPVEMALLEIWAQVLHLERIGIHDNFFELGGDSLLTTQAISRLRAVFQVELPLRSLFETPTVAALAAQVEQALRTESARDLPQLESVGRDGPLPLSFAQERLWFVHQLAPWSSAYHTPGALRLTGPLNRGALERTLHDLVGRHEAFRTTFVTVNGQPVQVISPLPNPSLEMTDLRGFPRQEREDRAIGLAEEEARRPFDLTSGPLLRVLLLQIGDEEHILLFNMHHIISDAWSLGLLTDEVLTLYNSYASEESVHLPILPIQYADFAVWQRQWLRDEALDALLAYWRKQLDGIQALELPTDHPRPVMQRYRGAVISEDIPIDLMDRLKRISNQEGVTLFMTLLAAFHVLLHRYTGQEDIAIGVPIANRNWLAVEGVVGSFVNTLVMRADVSGNPTVRELLQRVREVALGAYAHQDMPYARLVAELQPERDTSRTPLAQVMFNVVNVPMPSLQFKDLDVTPLQIDRLGAQFDLTLTVTDSAFLRQISIEYDTDLFTADTIGRMMGHFWRLLEGMMTNPEQPISSLPMLTEAERQQLTVAWNETLSNYPEEATFVELFEAQVERTPDAPAFILDREELSYQALNRRANQVAAYLRSLGVGPEVVVGVLLERSLDMAVGLLGVLKAGGAYLPLDPGYPEERLAFMLRDAGAAVLLTQESLARRLPQHDTTRVCLDVDRANIDRQIDRNPVSGTDADSLAYVLYTSGSTGQPKGVLGPFRGAVNRLAWMWRAYPFQAGEVCCQKTPLSFVDSVWEFFGPLLQGVPTVIIPDRVIRDPHQLIQALATHNVTRIVLVPSLLKAILDTHPNLQQRVPKLGLWVCSGETLPVELVQQFRKTMPQATLLNLYGSSEVAADVTWYDTAQLGADGLSVPIGRPIANTQIYLLDAHLNPVPVGVPGEIYAGGAGLARGYVNQPELTAERFVPDPFSHDPAARLYKTGDLARYRRDGNIDYLGRRDHQVKIRGFRIELGEIEAILRQHPAVAQAAVITLEESRDVSSPWPGTDRRMVAYLVAAEGAAPAIPDLIRFLGSRLPVYMIPSAFVFLDALPVNLHGKIDRQALAEIGEIRSPGGLDLPRDKIERQLAQIWQEVLGTGPIGVRDSFFELGGHSLLAFRLFARIKEVLGIELPVASLFQAPTVEQLAETIRQSGGLPDGSVLVPIQPGGSLAPFFCMHPVGGGVLGYAELARLLGPEQPVYGVQARGLEGRDAPHTRVENMAADYVEVIRRVQPQGPYCLGGYSSGGVLAFEIACQLQAQGEQVALVALFDTYAPTVPGAQRPLWHPLALIGFLRNAPYWLRDLLQREDGVSRLLARIRLAVQAAWLRVKGDTDSLQAEAAVLRTVGNADGIPEGHRRLILVHLRALESYRPQVFQGQLTLFRVRGMRLFQTYDADLGWERLATGGVDIQIIPGAHYNILEKPGVDALAARLRASLARARATHQEDRPQGHSEKTMDRGERTRK